MKYEKPLLYASATALVLYVFRERKLNTKKLAELEQQYKQAEANTSSESNYAVMNNILLQEIDTRVTYLSGLRGKNSRFGISVGASLKQGERTQHSEYRDLLRFLSKHYHMRSPPSKQSGFNEILSLINNKLKEMTIPEEDIDRLNSLTRNNPREQLNSYGLVVENGDYTFDKSPILKSMMKHPMSYYIATGEANMYDALRQAYYRDGTNNIWKTKFGY